MKRLKSAPFAGSGSLILSRICGMATTEMRDLSRIWAAAENQQMQEPLVPSTQPVPSDHYDYETMSSGFSEQCSDDDGADLLPVVNDGVAVDNEKMKF
ncbi:hypothetical protein KFK09_017450 [Dendrobium nobile]|uniref:Uncharacterized protein n=1 Tax=Dendrobium nobile TaxID=94219 RepID=A0A8T3B291_DENNO|nr:hypothetical protein KFK09_017450 [Dendrobium nobile]